MRRGLNGAGDGLLFAKSKIKQTNKTTPVGENRKAGKARQETFDDELAQDCKHEEIIKGANEEGNEERQVGQINQ